MGLKCWLGFHVGECTARDPDRNPNPQSRFVPWYTYTFKCTKCGHIWQESPKPYD